MNHSEESLQLSELVSNYQLFQVSSVTTNVYASRNDGILVGWVYLVRWVTSELQECQLTSEGID